MFFRKKVIYLKVESTYGTDITPSGTDAVLTSNLNINPYAGPTVSRNLDRDTLGGQTVVNTNPQVEVTFDVELAGSGTATVVPAWSECLRACGFSVAAASPTSAGQIYSPVSSSFASATIYYYWDGMRHILTGARGNVSINMNRGELPKLSFRFIGQYNRPTAASASANVTDYVAPLAVTDTNTPTFTLGGSPLQNLAVSQFTLDMGNNVVARNIINSNEIFISDRNPTGTIQFDMVIPSTKDWFAGGIESHNGVTTLALNLVHGTSAGNRVKISAPAVQMTGVTPTDSDGILTYSAATAYTPVSGNDEVTITTY